jgi:rubredoxin
VTQQSTEPAPTCDVCDGTGWANYPDPFLDGALIDARCPNCAASSAAPPDGGP